jgi:bacterioferritin-associated ferredoxin
MEVSMAYLCNCRAISSKKLDQYLKDQPGTVRLKDAMEACSNGASCCRAHAEGCAMAVQRVVDQHNRAKALDNASTIAPQSGPAADAPKEPVC